MTSDASRPPIVFISYSHDSSEHADRVLALSDHLRADGIDCVLDQYEESPPEGFPRWMERQIRGADFVLMICTPTYYRRVMGEEEPGKGHGVAWETSLIHQNIYNAGALNTRFIPVLLEGAREEDIPVPWQGVKYYRPETTKGYEELYRRLTGQPLTPKPALGTLRKMPPRERKQDFSSDQVKAQQVPTSTPTVDTNSANTRQATHTAPPPKNPRVLPLSIVNGLIIGILSSVIAGVLQKYVFDTGFLLRSLIILLILIVVSLFVGLVLEDRKISIPFNRWVAILVTGTLVFGLILTFVYDAIRPPTTYFLVDATVEMAPLFNEVSTEVRNSVIPNSRIGLRVFGGNISNTSGCGNTKLLIDPNAYNDPGTKLESNLSLIEPSGHSSLVGAVLAALNDLSGHNEPVKLTIITSGTDPVCDPQEGGILQSVAENIKSNVNIVIISIGNLNTQEAGILESYALAFHGGYVNIPTPAQLPQVVQTISSYGSRDYLYSRLTPTPTR